MKNFSNPISDTSEQPVEEGLEIITISGTIDGKLGNYNPIEDVGYVNDKNGIRYKKTKINFSRDVVPLSGEFYLYGEVPQEVLEFLPQKHFVLKEYYQKNEASRIPIRQDLEALQENGPMKEYKFERG